MKCIQRDQLTHPDVIVRNEWTPSVGISGRLRRYAQRKGAVRMAIDTEAERGRAPPCCWRPDDIIERHIRAPETIICRSPTSGSSSRWCCLNQSLRLKVP